MNYTEWRDELNNNLLSVSEAERRKVLDYYAEAYADRREAGFSEREIIAGFGAPYDAAQRILYDKGDEVTPPQNNTVPPPPVQPEPKNNAAPPPPVQPEPISNAEKPSTMEKEAAKKSDNTWIFVILCVIFCVPLFVVIMAMVGITIGFCVAPIAVIGSGAALIVSSFGSMCGSAGYGLYLLGGGLITLGVGIMLCPIFFKLVKLMWKIFIKLFNWIKSLFGGKV